MEKQSIFVKIAMDSEPFIKEIFKNKEDCLIDYLEYKKSLQLDLSDKNITQTIQEEEG